MFSDQLIYDVWYTYILLSVNPIYEVFFHVLIPTTER